MKKKDFLQHELLNIFTVLNILLEERNLTVERKHQMKSLLHLAGILVTHENLFLGRKPQFFRQNTSLYEILEVATASLQEEFRLKNINLYGVPRETLILCDRYYTREAISQILTCLLRETTFLKFSFSREETSLLIEHDIAETASLKQKVLSSCLHNKKLRPGDIGYHLGLYILEMQSRKPEISLREIKIFF